MSIPSFEDFDAAVKRGKLHQATGISKLGEEFAKNPIEMGVINGYSPDDIQHFYAMRSGVGQVPANVDSSRIRQAYTEFINDLNDSGAAWASLHPERAKTEFELPHPAELHDVEQPEVRDAYRAIIMAGDRPKNWMGEKIPPTEAEIRHAVAIRNSALPVEQGGLGLPPDNTAMDRAKALGYPIDIYDEPHSNMAFTRASTNAPMKKAEVIKAELEQLGIPVRGEQAASGSTYLDIPGNPYKVDERYGGGQSVPIERMRFSTHSKREYGKPINEPDSSFLADVFPKYGNTTDDARQAIQDMIARGGIRSRFAAFDPMQSNSANILAGTAAGGLGLGAMLPEEPQGYADGGLARGIDTPSNNPIGRYIQGVAGRTLHPLESMAEAATHYASMPVDELMNAALPRSGAIQNVVDDSMIRMIAEKYKLPWNEAAQEYFAKGTRVAPASRAIPEVPQPSQSYAKGGLATGYRTLPNTATVNKPSYAGLSGLRAGMTLNPAASGVKVLPTHTPLRAHLAMV